MTGHEWATLADRVSLLWPPAMTAEHVDAYWRIVEPLDARAVDQAITLIARQPRNHRPDPGLLYETAAAQRPVREALPAAVTDPLTETEHQRVLAELARRQSAEHWRRHQAVIDHLHATGRRIPLPVLTDLMPTSRCSAEEFDVRFKALTGDSVESANQR